MIFIDNNYSNCYNIFGDFMNFYDEKSFEYFNQTVNLDSSKSVKDFLKLVNGKRILELGCGSGRDSKLMLDLGYNVTSIDSSIKMCELASNYIGKKVINKNMLEINYKNKFNGVYANACLHHLKFEELPIMYKLIYDSLKKDGISYSTFKYGKFKGYINGRFFTFINEDMINYLIKNTKFKIIKYDMQNDIMSRDIKWLALYLKK